MLSLAEHPPIAIDALGRADLTRLEISPGLDRARRKEFGQFLTPAEIAGFMAGMFGTLPDDVRLLDAGAGVGSLTAAFVHEACRRADRPRTIDAKAFEIDLALAVHLENVLLDCAAECAAFGIAFTFEIIRDDYILHSSEPLFKARHSFNCAILNPPYAKISNDSDTRAALRLLDIETSNLYTAFVAVALGQLVPNGQLVAITPRSFCNGRYFDPFRRLMLARSAIRRIHVYNSRTHAFVDDDVLQENIVYHLVAGEQQPETVTITSNSGPRDPEMQRRDVAFADVVDPGDAHAYIHLAISDADGALAEKIRALPCSLRDLGISVSTGRVVDFRAREHLRMQAGDDTVPLIYAAHFDRGFVTWPRPIGKKPNALVSNAATRTLLVPRGTYVLTKRFTSKEEKRRLVSVVYDPEHVKADYVGFENHLNYFHVNGEGLSSIFARGLAVFLNSTAVDQYFRQFSGHTQVNATDLRNLRYPTVAQLVKAGTAFDDVFPLQTAIDAVVEDLL